MRFLFFIFFISFSEILFAQKHPLQIDSLKQKYKLSDNPSDAFNKIKDTLFYFYYNDINKAEEIIPYLKYYSDLLDNYYSKAVYYQNYGYFKEFKFEIDSAIYYLNKSIDYFNKDTIGNVNYINSEFIYNAIAIIYDNAGLYKSAIENHLKAVKFAEQILTSKPNSNKNKKFLASAYNDLAQTYSNINDSINAEYFFKKSIKFAKENGFKLIETTNKFNYAIFLFDLKRYEEAYPIFEDTKIILQKEDFNSYLIVNVNEAKINYQNKNYIKAIEICKKTINEADKHGYYDISEYSYLLLIYIYKDKKQLSQAIYYGKVLESMCKKFDNPSMEKQALFNLSQLYQEKKEYKKAFYYQKKYIKLNDSLFKVESEKRINNLKLKYNLEKKVTENKLLMAKNRMKDEKIKRQKTNNIILTGLIISGIIIFLLLLYYFRNAKKANRKLELLNEQLLENERELHLLNNTQKNLFAIISHDLRGPIGTAKSFFDILNNESLEISEEDRNNYIKTVGRTISSTYELLENVLFWSKHLLSNNEMENEDFYPFAVVNDILSNINSTLFTKEIVFRNLIDSNIKINSCPSVFKVVMRNLITNAIKFTHRKGEIIINMTQNEKDYIFSVKDNGIGIDTEKLDILFTTNIKQSTPGTENEKGSGLGLMISRELIKRMGGDIYAESEKDKGTTFYFTIPINSKK